MIIFSEDFDHDYKQEIAPDVERYFVSNELEYLELLIYHLFPGVSLILYDMRNYIQREQVMLYEDTISLDYVHDGKIEWGYKDNLKFIMEAGHLKLDNHQNDADHDRFPVSYFSGLTFLINVKEAAPFFKNSEYASHVDIEAFMNALFENDSMLYYKPEGYYRRIFDSFFEVPAQLRESVFKIKALEVFTCLPVIANLDNQVPCAYFKANTMSKVRNVATYIEKRPSEHLNQEDLAKRFDIPLSTLKQGFKTIYGCTVGQYATNNRMRAAASDLLNSNRQIGDIADKYGYSNSSKFSQAFKSVMGVLPKDYRKRHFN